MYRTKILYLIFTRVPHLTLFRVHDEKNLELRTEDVLLRCHLLRGGFRGLGTLFTLLLLSLGLRSSLASLSLSSLGGCGSLLRDVLRGGGDLVNLKEIKHKKLSR